MNLDLESYKAQQERKAAPKKMFVPKASDWATNSKPKRLSVQDNFSLRYIVALNKIQAERKVQQGCGHKTELEAQFELALRPKKLNRKPYKVFKVKHIENK